MFGKNFQFMVFTFLGNTLNLSIFTHVPPHLKLAPKSLSSHPRQKEITHSPRQHLFESLFPPTAERDGGNYNLFLSKFSQKI